MSKRHLSGTRVLSQTFLSRLIPLKCFTSDYPPKFDANKFNQHQHCRKSPKNLSNHPTNSLYYHIMCCSIVINRTISAETFWFGSPGVYFENFSDVAAINSDSKKGEIFQASLGRHRDRSACVCGADNSCKSCGRPDVPPRRSKN